MRVYGGMTGAGTRKGLQPRRGEWTCSQHHVNKGAWTRCLTAGCNEKRDQLAIEIEEAPHAGRYDRD